jgi:lipopolysaccharide/colanic/teichoic acid biosynthesis glycosyltransferase
MGRRSRRIAEERFDVRIVNQTVLGAMFDGAGDAPSPPKGKRSAIADLRTAEVPLMLLFGLLLLPLTLLVAAMTLLFLGRPILFVQRRAGRDGVAFPLIKFRTMRILFDDGGRLLPDAARLSRFGRLIRRLRLDELPEVWNILRGDMALVGPRPLLPETVAAMGAAGERRGAVRPGLTGWAQVNGNALLSVREKLALDLWYVAHRSIRLDIYILWRTLVMLITGERVNSALVGRAYAGTADRGC